MQSPACFKNIPEISQVGFFRIVFESFRILKIIKIRIFSECARKFQNFLQHFRDF